MRIGELARAAGVNIQTIRFYEREGLLPPPARTTSGYRSYQKRDLERVMFIRRNHAIGFTLAEVQELLLLHAALEKLPRPMRRKPAEVRQIIVLGRERLGQINGKIRALQRMKKQLEFVVHHLEESAPTTCPVAIKDAGTQPARLPGVNSARISVETTPSQAHEKGKRPPLATVSSAVAGGPKVMRTETRSLSPDGKIMTVESVRGSNAAVVMVFDRR